jgi:hypothetical protein
MAPQIARMLGPVVVTTLLIGWGTAGWLVLGSAFLAAGLLVRPLVRWAVARTPGVAAEAVPTARAVVPQLTACSKHQRG